MFPCDTCGAVVSDGRRHVAWHERHGDIDEGRACPIDRAEIAYSRASAARSTVTWTCGHSLTRTEPLEAPGE